MIEKVIDIKEKIKIAEVELNIQKAKKEILENNLKKYQEFLNNSSKTEHKLFYKIAFESKNVTQAVKEIVDENYLKDKKPASESGVWKIYKKMKKNFESEVIL